MEVLPVVNCDLAHEECVVKKLKIIQKLSRKVHLDVADGRFTYNKTWGDAARWQELNPNLELEVHLMVEEPEKAVSAWLAAGARRVIVHVETVNDVAVEHLAKVARSAGARLMLAMNPETPPETALAFSRHAKEFQVLAVHPGLAGQKFLPVVLHKIDALRAKLPDALIEVDGGMNPANARAAQGHGANCIAVSSYILNHENPKTAYEELSKI